MRTTLIWIIVIVLAAGLGLGAAAGVGALTRRAVPSLDGWGIAGRGPGMMGGYGGNRSGGLGPGGLGPGMMGGYGSRWGAALPSGQRLSLEEAVERAESYAARYGAGLEVAEVMEFEDNFYAVVREADTGRGAFEVLIDPYSGAVSPEPGPNRMWNLKYGHMRRWGSGDSTLTLEQARQRAQQALDASLRGATVHEEGFAFYGYYTFDYDIDGRVAGMLSVNGVTGSVWPHTWHGQFVAEQEMEK